MKKRLYSSYHDPKQSETIAKPKVEALVLQLRRTATPPTAPQTRTLHGKIHGQHPVACLSRSASIHLTTRDLMAKRPRGEDDFAAAA